MLAPMDPSRLVVRPALAEDYPAFCRLFPELGTQDALPSFQSWVAERRGATLLAERAGSVVGYCYYQEYADTGYIRNLVVAPRERRRGVGQALMQALGKVFRGHGKSSWRLNVKPDNRAAVALYEQVGMETKYSSRALRLPWAHLSRLPTGSRIEIRELCAAHDEALETLFGLPRAQLATARGHGHLSFRALAGPEQTCVGLAVFNPDFPGAFPFRASELDATFPLLSAMRQHVPSHEWVNIVTEDDPRLAALLEGAGASVSMDILHMVGSL
jgi:GNAT superfamily N-acetyltransferase